MVRVVVLPLLLAVLAIGDYVVLADLGLVRAPADLLWFVLPVAYLLAFLGFVTLAQRHRRRGVVVVLLPKGHQPR